MNFDISSPSGILIEKFEITIDTFKSDQLNYASRYDTIKMLLQNLKEKSKGRFSKWATSEYLENGFTLKREPDDLLFLARTLEHDMELKLDFAESESDPKTIPSNWEELDQLCQNLEHLFLKFSSHSQSEIKKYKQLILDTRKKYLKELKHHYASRLGILDKNGNITEGNIKYRDELNKEHVKRVVDFKIKKSGDISTFVGILEDDVEIDVLKMSRL